MTTLAPVVDAAEVQRRVIEPADFVADTEAFLDVRIPGSAGKASYSMIGPGVSQNADQTVNLDAAHGFNIGAASMPSGVVNNPHLHYTAEVFLCTRGRWEMRLGQHGEQTLEIGPGTVFSVPTWVFRGFENIGGDDGWLFAVLGGDDTGGILWAPEILEAAAGTGLYLSRDDDVIEAPNGQAVADVVEPVDQALLSELDEYTDDELADLVVAHDRLDWSERALLSHLLPGHESALAPVIGFGLTEDRRQRPPIWTPHGFSMEWLRLAPGASTGSHRVDRSQVVITIDGRWAVTYNRHDDSIETEPATGSVVSVPAGVWRELANPGDTESQAVVICGSDSRSTLEWDDEIVAAARAIGWTRDASGYLAPLPLVAASGR